MTDLSLWQLASNQSDFLDLQAEWERLFQENPRHSPFLAWGWVNAWLKHIAGAHKLQIACLRDTSGALQFVLPLLRPTDTGRIGTSKLMLVCSYGPECSENLGCLCTPALEPQSAKLSAQAIAHFFGPGDAISLGVLDSTGGYPARLKAAMQGSGRTVRVRSDVVYPTACLPSSWEEYLQKLSTNFRSQVRRYYKQINSQDQARFRSLDQAEAEVFTRQLIHLNRSRMQAKGEVSSLEDEALRNFLGDAVPYMASRHLAWMDIIEHEGKVLGSSLNFVHGDSVYYYMGGFDEKASKLRPGTALFALVLQRSIDAGYSKYDFLRGDEAYKYRWGAEDVSSHRVAIYPRGRVHGFLASVVDDLCVMARDLIKHSSNLTVRRR